MTLPSGLYVVKTRSSRKSVDHYALADRGNRLGLLQSPNVFRPNAIVLVHQTPPAVQFETLAEGLGPEWTVVGAIRDEAGARARLEASLANSRYNLLDHNCEHFVWFIATGERKSPQLRGGVALVGIAAFLWWLNNGEN